MLAFALKWRHWNGGPDEDIFVEFGITPPEFFHRLRVLLTRDRWNRLDPEILDQLVKVCDERIGAIDIRSVATAIGRSSPRPSIHSAGSRPDALLRSCCAGATLTRPSLTHFTEVPAHDLRRFELQPRVPAVVGEVASAGILVGEKPFGFGKFVDLVTSARYLTDVHRSPA